MSIPLKARKKFLTAATLLRNLGKRGALFVMRENANFVLLDSRTDECPNPLALPVRLRGLHPGAHNPIPVDDAGCRLYSEKDRLDFGKAAKLLRELHSAGYEIDFSFKEDETTVSADLTFRLTGDGKMKPGTSDAEAAANSYRDNLFRRYKGQYPLDAGSRQSGRLRLWYCFSEVALVTVFGNLNPQKKAGL